MKYLKTFENIYSDKNAKYLLLKMLEDLDTEFKKRGIKYKDLSSEVLQTIVQSDIKSGWVYMSGFKYRIREDNLKKAPIDFIECDATIITSEGGIDNWDNIYSFLTRYLGKWNDEFNKTNLFLVWEIRKLNEYMKSMKNYEGPYTAELTIAIKEKKYQRINPTPKALHFSFRKNRDHIEKNGITASLNKRWSKGEGTMSEPNLGIDEPVVYLFPDFRWEPGRVIQKDGQTYLSDSCWWSIITYIFGKFNEIDWLHKGKGWSKEDVQIDLWEIDTSGLGYKWYRDSNSSETGVTKRLGFWDWIVTFDGDIPPSNIKLLETYDIYDLSERMHRRELRN